MLSDGMPLYRIVRLTSTTSCPWRTQPTPSARLDSVRGARQPHFTSLIIPSHTIPYYHHVSLPSSPIQPTLHTPPRLPNSSSPWRRNSTTFTVHPRQQASKQASPRNPLTAPCMRACVFALDVTRKWCSVRKKNKPLRYVKIRATETYRRGVRLLVDHSGRTDGGSGTKVISLSLVITSQRR